jgi:hypothetical protein
MCDKRIEVYVEVGVFVGEGGGDSRIFKTMFVNQIEWQSNFILRSIDSN